MLGSVLAGLVSVICGAGDVFEGAEWLRDPRFAGTEVVDVFQPQREDAPTSSELKNIHTLFRGVINIREKPRSALLYITGDDYYKFYINGEFVVQGPEPCYPWVHGFYWLDVTSFLQKGQNCLGSHAYYQGLVNRMGVSGDNRAGFKLALEVKYADGSAERFATKPSWKCFQLQAFPGDQVLGFNTQFAEDIDMRAMPVGWRNIAFDDSAWLAPLTGAQDHEFKLQTTPPLRHHDEKPYTVEAAEDGRYFYDFGRELAGHTRIRLKGPEGAKVIVRHGEELKAPSHVLFDLRANCDYAEVVTLSGADDLVEFYDYKGFRYIEILNAPVPPEVWVDVRGHAFNADAVSFTAENMLLEKIWNLCRNGVETGAQGVFINCPTREKAQYIGDTVIAARSHLWLTGDASLTKKAIEDIAASARIDEGLMAIAPAGHRQQFAEYTLQFPLLLRTYYQHTGDVALVRAVLSEALPKLFAHYARFENDTGLLEKIDEAFAAPDGEPRFRDGHDDAQAKDHAGVVVNAFYYGALRSAAELERAIGKDGKDYDGRADRVRAAFASELADTETGLYVDAVGSEHSSLHANVVPLCFGLTEGADREKMIAFIREKRLGCGVYMAAYLLEGLFRYGAGDLAFELLTCDDNHSWSSMIDAGATTCMETWAPGFKKNTAWCHPWSGSPIYLITEYVFGLSAAVAGFSELRIAPQEFKALPAMELILPLPQGPLYATYSSEAGYNVTLPAGVTAKVEAAEGVKVTVQDSGKTPVADSDNAPAAPAGDVPLASLGWNERVGEGRGALIDVAAQRMYLIEAGKLIWERPCATALKGVGSEAGSNKTPLGWHTVSEKIGAGAAKGAVFRSRGATKEIWEPGMDTKQDLVLTRILWLDGLEPGVNRGRNAQGINVDSKKRYIYIHGTNGEEQIGTPSSHGCIRLKNDDVIEVFELMPEGMHVLIVESLESKTTVEGGGGAL